MNKTICLIANIAALSLAGCEREPAATTQQASGNQIAPGNAAIAAPKAEVLKLVGSSDFPGYVGDFDHFAIAANESELFLAGEENHELDVMDLATGGILKRLPGYGAPHSLHYMPDTNEMLVIDGDKPSPVLDAATLKVKRVYNLPKGADSVSYDASTRHLWIVTGGKDVPQKDSNLIEIDPATGRTIKSVHFDADHVEALAVEQNGPNLYVNVTDKNYLAEIDKASGKIVKQWPIKEAEQNAPLAIDEITRRLFVVTRKPGKLIVLNADTGATVAALKAPGSVDQVTWDPGNRRIYVTGGEGYTSVVEQEDPDTYKEIAQIRTLPGAKTAILDPAHKRLWIAASPGESKALGKVLRYDVAPR